MRINGINIVDYEFNGFMEKEMKIVIAYAFISLEANLKRRKLHGGFSEREISLVEKKASQMKQELNSFIDSQTQRIIEDSKIREQNDCQVPE